MDNLSIIKKFLKDLKRPCNAEGTESEVYFVQDKKGNKYALKSFFGCGGFSFKFGPEASFWENVELLKKKSDELIKRGVSIPKIYDFGILENSESDKKILQLEERMPGSPIYILRVDSFSREGDVRDESRVRRQKYNIKQQEKLLDASEGSFYKLISDFKEIYTQPTQIGLDQYSENFLFDPVAQKFSIIDINAKRPENHVIGIQHIVVDVLSLFSLSQDKIAKISQTMNSQGKIINSNHLLVDKVTNILDDMGMLVARSQREKEWMLKALSYSIADLSKLEEKISVGKKK